MSLESNFKVLIEFKVNFGVMFIVNLFITKAVNNFLINLEKIPLMR